MVVPSCGQASLLRQDMSQGNWSYWIHAVWSHEHAFHKLQGLFADKAKVNLLPNQTAKEFQKTKGGQEQLR